MSENYTDYDLENSIRQVALRLDLAECSSSSGKPLHELFSDIEEKCPEAAQLLLERTFEKDKLKSYIANKPQFPTINGAIISEGDPTFEAHWQALVNSYPMLLDAIEACRK